MFTSYNSMFGMLVHVVLFQSSFRSTGFPGSPVCTPQVVSDSELQATSSKGSSAATAGSSPAKLGALNLEKKTVLETVPGLEKNLWDSEFGPSKHRQCIR